MLSFSAPIINTVHIKTIFLEKEKPNCFSLFMFRFSVDPKIGTILTTDVLDYENGPRYEFYLEARDGGGIFYEKSSSITIIINIKDVNDNSPVFINLPYITAVDENKISSNYIFKVSFTTTIYYGLFTDPRLVTEPGKVASPGQPFPRQTPITVDPGQPFLPGSPFRYPG